MSLEHEVTGEGVLFQSKESAQKYADAHDKDLVEADGRWLAKNRVTEHGPMPTKEGDVVILHCRQLYLVWVTRWDGAQGPHPNERPPALWAARKAEEDATNLAEETEGKIYLLEKSGQWSVKSN